MGLGLAAAPSATDAEVIAARFTKDAEVKDEGDTRRGRGAIHKWWEGPANTFEYAVEVQSTEAQADDRCIVLPPPDRQLPGGKADLTNRF
jgi:ketosteroid isomerase-like protein